jgi:hypothetical protein
MHLVFLSLLLLTPLLSSAVRDSPVFDAYSTSISIKQENARLDNYAIQLKNSPSSRGIIIAYSEDEQSAPSVKARARRAVRYLVKTRGIDAAKVVMRYDGVCRPNQLVLYLLYPDQVDPTPDPTCFRAR